MHLRILLSVTLSTLALAACDEDDCVAGETTTCSCPGGTTGTSTCRSDGIAGACVCAGGDGGVDSGPADSGPADTSTAVDTGPRCTTGNVDERLNESSARGMWTRGDELCPGARHVYGLGVGCSGPLPACGTCNVSATLTYDNAESNVALQIYLNNGEVLRDEASESGSPKTASAVVEDGGSFSVRVNHSGGPPTDYSVDVVYECP